jgi:7-cyano-7-deazaguanine synthase in queuosine biosynthesis
VTADSAAPQRVLLFSGGLDSLAMWFLLGKPQPLYVTLGQRYEEQERLTVARLTSAIPGLHPTYREGPDIGGRERDGWLIPHRNLSLLLTAAHAFPSAHTIYLGSLADDTAPDTTRRFMRAATRALSLSDGTRIAVKAPAARLTKTQLVRRFVREHTDDALTYARLTRSCYAATDEPCQECRACYRRHQALYYNGILSMPMARPASLPPDLPRNVWAHDLPRFPRMIGGPW